jgi:Uncharacterized conserved protein (DUF2358)
MRVMPLLVLFDSTARRRRIVAHGFVVGSPHYLSPSFVGTTEWMARPQLQRRPSSRVPLISKEEFRCPSHVLYQQRNDRLQEEIHAGAVKSETFESTDAASKGLVSTLTSLINSVMERLPVQAESTDPFNANPSSERTKAAALDNRSSADESQTALLLQMSRPPRSPDELLDRIRNDYTEKNYLWTGNLDVAAFDPQCAFQDPTLSFRGTDRFVQNVRNLRPIVDAIVTSCRSDLISIRLNDDEGYVQTRWNMVGDLGRLPWRPRIDVVGQTKFWYRPTPLHPSTVDIESWGSNAEFAVVVVRYDEEWEIPAYRALLQLVTPGDSHQDE